MVRHSAARDWSGTEQRVIGQGTQQHVIGQAFRVAKNTEHRNQARPVTMATVFITLAPGVEGEERSREEREGGRVYSEPTRVSSI